MTSRVVVHEAGHALVGLMTGRRVVEVWVEFEPFCWFPGGVARIRRGLAVDVAGFLAEDLAAGVDRKRLGRRLAGGYSGPVHLDDRAAVRKAWAIRTGGLLDDYHTQQVFWQQATHGRHEDILAERRETHGVARPGPKHRILVVDDNRDGAASLAMLLTVLGNDTRTAHDGLQGVELAEAFRPDLIVLDIGLPRLNGYEACRRLREKPWAKNTVIVAATGWGQEEDRRRSAEAGFDHHLVKPVDAAEGARLLARWRP
jgi:CheY-like chemotaxis protein